MRRSARRSLPACLVSRRVQRPARADHTDAAWHNIVIESRHTPMLIGGTGTLDNAVDLLRTGSLGRTMLAGVDPATTARAIDTVRCALKPYATGDGVPIGAAVWLVTARA
jgi:hypothetical protein